MPQRRVAGEVEDERRLAEAGPRRDDDQVAALEARREHRVEVRVSGGDGSRLGGDGRSAALKLLQVTGEQLADVLEVTQRLALTHGGDQGLGLAEGATDVRAAPVGDLSDLPGRRDHLAVGGIALDDARVVLDADGRWQVSDETAQIGEATDVFQAAVSLELMGNRDLVDRLVAVPEGAAGVVDPAVLLAEEVVAFEAGRDLEDRLGVDEKRSDDRFFGLVVVGRQLLAAPGGSGFYNHGLCCKEWPDPNQSSSAEGRSRSRR